MKLKPKAPPKVKRSAPNRTTSARESLISKICKIVVNDIKVRLHIDEQTRRMDAENRDFMEHHFGVSK